MFEKLPLALHRLEGRVEVGVTNLYGSFRLLDFISIPESILRPGETTEEVGQAYIEHLQACSDAFFESRSKPLQEPSEVKVEVPVTAKWRVKPNREGIWLVLLLDEGVIDGMEVHHIYEGERDGKKTWMVGHHQRPNGPRGFFPPSTLEKFLAQDRHERTLIWQLLTTDSYGTMGQEVLDRNGLAPEGCSNATLYDLEWMLYGDLQTCSPELVPIVTENLTNVRAEMSRRNLKREPSVETEYARSEESRKENGFEEFNPWEHKGDVMPIQTSVVESEWPG